MHCKNNSCGYFVLALLLLFSASFPWYQMRITSDPSFVKEIVFATLQSNAIQESLDIQAGQ